ncbi:MAG: peptide chain release factor N(5)-glutamine methyltransferase [Planctomycetes bacterium]|nr:peptide chain release factor N(5)-glutamine methyltransferase [Planctomycetota bacterium]
MSTEPRQEDSDWTIARLLSWTCDYLTRHDVDDPRLAGEVLLAHATRRRRIELYARPEHVPPREDLARFRDLVAQAAGHEPIAYLVGAKEFFSLSFKVTRDVLVPRPETELLVEKVIDYCRGLDRRALRLLDLGTGSGCVAIAALVHVPDATVVATDISVAALKVAQANAERHGVAERIALCAADALALPQTVVPDSGFDVLMSNPPYVAADAMDHLPPAVRRGEPRLALTDEKDGLSFYRGIATNGPALLSSQGVVFVEIGDGQAQAARDALEEPGMLRCQRTWKDSVTGQPRVLMLTQAGPGD